MVYTEVSEVAQRRIDAIADDVAAMGRSTVKNGLRLGKMIGKEYKHALASTGDASNTVSAERQIAFKEASVWLASNCSESFVENQVDRITDDAMAPMFRNSAFRNRNEIDQISPYVAEAVIAVLLEDGGFLETNEPRVTLALRLAWTSLFGYGVFLLNAY